MQGRNFDGTLARHRNFFGNADRLVEILGIDQEVAAKLFASLRERTIGHEAFSVGATRTLVAIAVGCKGLAARYCPLALSWCASWVDST